MVPQRMPIHITSPDYNGAANAMKLALEMGNQPY